MEEQNIENKIVIYKSKDGKINLDINFDKETVWLTQEQISTLFGVDRTVVTRHINNIFKDGEISERSNVQKMHIANSNKPLVFTIYFVVAKYFESCNIQTSQFVQIITKS